MIKNAKVSEIQKWKIENCWSICPETGDEVKLGNGVTLGDGVKLGNGVMLGNGVTLGNWVMLGNRVKLGDGVKLDISPIQFFGHENTYEINYFSAGYISSGCIIKPVKWWEENIRRCAEEHNYSPADIDEYEWRVKVIAEWMKRHNLYEPKD
ncbi:MAG: hypothetical protein ABII09_03715 [Planctomycetota bacterium]